MKVAGTAQTRRFRSGVLHADSPEIPTVTRIESHAGLALLDCWEALVYKDLFGLGSRHGLSLAIIMIPFGHRETARPDGFLLVDLSHLQGFA